MEATLALSHKDQLVEHVIPFLNEVKDMTTGTDVERWLNEKYGTESDFHRETSRLMKIGVLEEGWAANVEIGGHRYRRSRLVDPSETTFGFSITAVYLDSTNNTQNNPENSFRGEYHSHPYGEFNMVISLNEGAALAGPNGWCYGGWTAPAPGSHHYPEVKDGAVIALFFLPAGRIAYNVKAPDAR
ncbi:DUF4863 family protein [Paraburkholderia fungorum]|uniref:4-hydroxylaminobenzoate lyase n=1 Tax=Paraburkholderia fungorum TaxID=134537 RepID=UPI0038B6DAB2